MTHRQNFASLSCGTDYEQLANRFRPIFERIAEGAVATIAAKLEFFNPAHSVKDRIAAAMVDAALAAGKTLTYSTAWGGPLFLNYGNAKPGSVVTLRVRGSVKYAHFDFTRNPGSQEIDEAVSILAKIPTDLPND